ncbi:nucleotidyltransferase domain-containing protein [Chryseobacterium flavum]|uniref:Nucleotidyltransferase domain-containing protein n=1 Tax=Chryseobacterium flavum TaxID=415851 RepID=A0A3D9CUK2_9FLAO|nr:nucleotidyltransferase domain-containing protein [Chryseobacterium flavum]REC69308.1 nucleotidyltransferase domain-containing protein [Chryseobacterium flavum]
MIQQEFASNAVKVLEPDDQVIGLAVAGSWLTDELDEFSDLDLILVTKEKISDDKNLMLEYAGKLGHLLSGFTGEHVGEKRLLICLYDHPLLHVDIKFLTLEEFHDRVETPTLLLDKNHQLEKVIHHSEAIFPHPDYQWIEDRFWTWIHYALTKAGRGEYMEAYDFLGFLRMVVLGPLLHIKNGTLPRGVRKVETELSSNDLADLLHTIPEVYNKRSILNSIEHAVSLYRQLRTELYGKNVHLLTDTEKRVMEYFKQLS